MSVTKLRASVIPACLFMIWSLTACTPKVYGVPQEQWSRMDETQRKATIQAYQRRQAEVQRERKRQEQRRKEQAAEQQRAAMHAERYQQRQIAAIYAGRAGVHGDLIRVSIQGGQVEFCGKHKSYQPLSFRLANAERKKVSFRRGKGRCDRLDVYVKYADGNFLFDTGESVRSETHARRFLYDKRWDSGVTYTVPSMSDKTASDAKDISIRIEVIPLPAYRR